MCDDGGSSPRGRGRLQLRSSSRLNARLIPARAGTALARSWLDLARWAHPRAGGDGVWQRGGRVGAYGSSPRGRGRPPHGPARHPGVEAHPRAGGDGRRGRNPGRVHPGLIPARAGTAPIGLVNKYEGAGSSPRGRGRRHWAKAERIAERLIPARAGTALRGGPPRLHREAHPRAGGDGWRKSSPARHHSGSSPRGRGRPLAGERADGLGRLIPARAGTAFAGVRRFPGLRGSSPRGRGRPGGKTHQAGRGRLIPARAGTACPDVRRHSGGRAHPRAGGDGAGRPPGSPARGGSSPRGRGRRRAWCAARTRRRLIPARAGTAGDPTPEPIFKTAHPRAGGDGTSRSATVPQISGSSPRGRGRPLNSRRERENKRLIPARAGTAPVFRVEPAKTKAHPRAGGDGWTADDGVESWSGSSPRGRGRPTRRYIPSSGMRAHPRAGGDGRITGAHAIGDYGSSPRGRGRPPGVPRAARDRRLIPARAGTAWPPWSRPWCGSAHPRAGGDGFRPPTRTGAPDGSSPRGRGRPTTRCGPPARPGLIPARAGTADRYVRGELALAAHPRAGGDGFSGE